MHKRGSMNPDDNTPQKPVTPPMDGPDEPARPTPWVPSDSDGADGANTGNVANGTVQSGLDNGAVNNNEFGSPALTPEPGPGPGMPEPPQPPTFNTAGMPPSPEGSTPPMPGADPTGAIEPPQPSQPPMPPVPGQPGMPGGAPQFGVPVQSGMPDGNTPLAPMPDGPQTQPTHATSPALMMGLLAIGVIIIIGFIIFMFLKK